MIGITGSEGYIGSKMIEETGDSCIGFDIVNGDDILDEERIEEKFQGVDSIIHLAAISGLEDCRKNPTQAIQVNIRGTINIAKFCNDKDIRLIFASSFAADRGNLYGETKKCGEEIIRKMCDDYLIFKMSNVYGGDKQTVVNIFIDSWSEGLPLEVHSPGTQVRDFIHRQDVIQAYINAVESDYVGKISLVSGEVVSIEELAKEISDDVRIIDEGYDDEIFSLEADTDELSRIGFKPEISLEEGIKKEKNDKKDSNIRM